MEISVQDLLDKINKEGTEAALKEKERIINEANLEKERIIKEAQDNAKKIVEDAEKEASKLNEQGKVSLSQAARNVRLDLKNELNDMLSKALNVNLKATLTSSDYVNIISAAVKATGESTPSIELSSSLYKGTAESVMKAINGASVSENATLKSGFRLSVKDGKAYYDFTDKEIFDLLSQYLSEGLNKVLSQK